MENQIRPVEMADLKEYFGDYTENILAERALEKSQTGFVEVSPYLFAKKNENGKITLFRRVRFPKY